MDEEAKLSSARVEEAARKRQGRSKERIEFPVIMDDILIIIEKSLPI